MFTSVASRSSIGTGFSERLRGGSGFLSFLRQAIEHGSYSQCAQATKTELRRVLSYALLFRRAQIFAMESAPSVSLPMV